MDIATVAVTVTLILGAPEYRDARVDVIPMRAETCLKYAETNRIIHERMPGMIETYTYCMLRASYDRNRMIRITRDGAYHRQMSDEDADFFKWRVQENEAEGISDIAHHKLDMPKIENPADKGWSDFYSDVNKAMEYSAGIKR